MTIFRDDKMRPLFQEAIVTKLAVTQSTTRYQMKATDIIFPMMSNLKSGLKLSKKFSPFQDIPVQSNKSKANFKKANINKSRYCQT